MAETARPSPTRPGSAPTPTADSTSGSTTGRSRSVARSGRASSDRVNSQQHHSPFTLPPMTIPVLSPEESSAWDQAAEAAGISLATLMETAGRACAAVLARRFGPALGQGALVAVGPGNNGG